MLSGFLIAHKKTQENYIAYYSSMWQIYMSVYLFQVGQSLSWFACVKTFFVLLSMIKVYVYKCNISHVSHDIERKLALRVLSMWHQMYFVPMLRAIMRHPVCNLTAPIGKALAWIQRMEVAAWLTTNTHMLRTLQFTHWSRHTWEYLQVSWQLFLVAFLHFFT